MADATPEKKLILSGIQPTGTFTLGNYIGAVKNWLAMQAENDCLFAFCE